MAHVVVGIVLSFLSSACESIVGWQRGASSIKFFFKRTKDLMHLICKGEDWEKAKEVLSIFLSIQRQFLSPHPESDDTMLLAKWWVEEYEFILNSFEPNDLDAFLRLFRELQSKAIEYKGQKPNDINLKFPISKLFNLFKLYCHYFYHVHWEKLADVANFPPKLLYLICIRFSRGYIFKFLWDINKGNPTDFFIFNDDISKIKKIYEKKFNHGRYILCETYRASSEASKFLVSIKTNNSFGLGERQLWIIDAILYVLPIFKSS
jgi:hypothetical protein